MFNPLPGVPPVESPFFSSIASKWPAETNKIARSINEKGYAVVDFPDPEIGRIAEAIKAALNDRYDWDGWRSGQVNSLSMRIPDAWTIDENVKRISSSPAIIELLSTIYGRRAFPFQTLNFAVGTQQHFHSDSVHFSSCPERYMCGVWVALEDVDETNGPLIYYPGSHRWPIYTNEHVGANAVLLSSPYEAYPKFEAMWRGLVEASDIKPERFLARKGQALIWAANLLHGGDSQIDLKRSRWSQVTHYFFEGCSYYTPLMSDPFCGRIFFREPTDAASGRKMKNFVSGVEVPHQFIKATAPPQ